MRATVSVADPAGKGTTMRIGFVGNWASAATGTESSTNNSVLNTGSPYSFCFSLILVHTANIKRGKTKLQSDERPGVVVPSPHYPEDIARQEAPESDGPLVCRARSDKVGG